MKTTEVKLYSLNYSEIRTYLFGLLFVAGNIILPQCCHLIPQGGLTWLPIYFFTLIGAYKFGWKVGLLTAFLSPLVNSFAFGMPAAAMLPGILLKSCVLAGTCPPLPESITRTAACCRTGLSDNRYIGRMADLRRYLDCISRFQNRSSGNGCSGNWRLSLYQILEILTESSK